MAKFKNPTVTTKASIIARHQDGRIKAWNPDAFKRIPSVTWEGGKRLANGGWSKINAKDLPEEILDEVNTGNSITKEQQEKLVLINGFKDDVVRIDAEIEDLKSQRLTAIDGIDDYDQIDWSAVATDKTKSETAFANAKTEATKDKHQSIIDEATAILLVKEKVDVLDSKIEQSMQSVQKLNQKITVAEKMR